MPRVPLSGQECQDLQLHGDDGGGGEGIAVLQYLPREYYFPFHMLTTIYLCDIYLQKYKFYKRFHPIKT